MTIAIYAQLAVLALIDSTSIGTLLIPLWLLLRPDARRILPRILLYLGVLAFFYLLIGIAMLSGLEWALNGLNGGSLEQLPVIQWVMLLGGAGMLAYALAPNPAKREKQRAIVSADSSAGVAGTGTAGTGTGAAVAGAEIKWHKRLSKALLSPGGIVGLALLAGLLELPTMLPYLVAIRFLSNSTLALPGEIAVLAIYCLLMLIPALVLVLLRVLLGRRLDPLLQRVRATLGKIAGETLLWVVGIVGFLLLRGGLSVLAPDAPWNPFK
ncbi:MULTISPECIES: GAP family protein [Arthrobacter]|uniref:GAP family protein n=1 Tax=Arthrobacter psychrochitiniphilus TaxID=291045 RepID=A0A2V3DVL2_9MICC|nr:GAP family protein [Arthrobacter psychrochitiniphilus]NYG16445.1 cytochrome c biogenesis protein CcdA [Arthrobacter psychrochitiniphilus]PXA69406.1 hypothetical protein CVS29_02325 [Arthrobacter psychrochitiniphilus]